MAVRVRHYSRRTEEAYVMWVRRSILFHGKKHPSAMGADEANAFLTDLAVEVTSARRRRIRPSVRCCFSTGRSCRSRCPGSTTSYARSVLNVFRSC